MELLLKRVPKNIYRILDRSLDKILVNNLPSDLSIDDAATLLAARDSPSVSAIAAAADACRAAAPCGENVSYVVNRNINFTNACVMRCGFCAFSRTGIDEEAYFLPLEEIVRRAVEAANLGATEICIQAGLPPNMDKDLYVTVAKAVKEALPDIHLHAFSPEEIIYGAKRKKISVLEMITVLKEAGVNSFPGTSAEILDDDVRESIAKGRLSSSQWKDTVQAAHSLKLSTTATMMYGHIETVHHVAHHIATIREIQTESKNKYNVGFTEFVPLSFVAKESPMWKSQQKDDKASNSLESIMLDEENSKGSKGPHIRSGPTGVEVILTHAVSRLMLAGHIDNIQVSWPKEGYRMSQVLLGCGVNDLGGTLLNESISTAAGAAHGQFTSPSLFRSIIKSANRIPYQRNTDYSVRRTFQEEVGLFPGTSSEVHSSLDYISDSQSVFGSYSDLTKSSENRYIDHHRKGMGEGSGRRERTRAVSSPIIPNGSSGNINSKRSYSTSTSTFKKDVIPDSIKTTLMSRRMKSTSAVPNILPNESLKPSTASASSSTPSCTSFCTSTSSSCPQGRQVSYSSSFTIVPTYECFNLCTYCNFRTNVRADESHMMTINTAKKILIGLKQQNESTPLSAVHEILILSGEMHPRSKRREGWLNRVREICSLCLDMGFLPHTNVGPLSMDEMRILGAVNSSMGLMLEQSVPLEVHRFAPSKVPALRLEQLTQAGELGIPFTTGILLGIGESFSDRIKTLQDIADMARKYGNIQEVIIQPYSPGAKDKYGTSGALGFDLIDLPLFVSQARTILPSDVLIQIPPNLILKNNKNHELGAMQDSSKNSNCDIVMKNKEICSGVDNAEHKVCMKKSMENENMEESVGNMKNEFLISLLDAGARDLGGISPLDEVNPTYSFQNVQLLKSQLQYGDYELVQRLPVYERHYSLLNSRVKNVIDEQYCDFYSISRCM